MVALALRARAVVVRLLPAHRARALDGAVLFGAFHRFVAVGLPAVRYEHMVHRSRGVPSVGVRAGSGSVWLLGSLGSCSTRHIPHSHRAPTSR